jgi:glucose-1-phosphate adenylyltransferase
MPGVGRTYLASMGIYVFGRAALERSLENPGLVDFGRHVIPDAVPRMRVQAYAYRGYWEDVGTIRSYYDSNLALCQPVPPFDFYDATHPVYSHPRFLPATKVESCRVQNSLLCEGSILVGAEVEHSLVGIRSRVGRGVRVRDSLLLGADRYETLEEMKAAEGRGEPAIGVGEDSEIGKAIVDMNARIGKGVRIVNEAGLVEADGEGYQIRDGIVVVCKDAVIPDGTVI